MIRITQNLEVGLSLGGLPPEGGLAPLSAADLGVYDPDKNPSWFSLNNNRRYAPAYFHPPGLDEPRLKDPALLNVLTYMRDVEDRTGDGYAPFAHANGAMAHDIGYVGSTLAWDIQEWWHGAQHSFVIAHALNVSTEERSVSYANQPHAAARFQRLARRAGADALNLLGGSQLADAVVDFRGMDNENFAANGYLMLASLAAEETPWLPGILQSISREEMRHAKIYEDRLLKRCRESRATKFAITRVVEFDPKLVGEEFKGKPAADFVIRTLLQSPDAEKHINRSDDHVAALIKKATGVKGYRPLERRVQLVLAA